MRLLETSVERRRPKASRVHPYVLCLVVEAPHTDSSSRDVTPLHKGPIDINTHPPRAILSSDDIETSRYASVLIVPTEGAGCSTYLTMDQVNVQSRRACT